MNTKITRAFALILSLILLFSSCTSNGETEDASVTVDLNETQTLFVGVADALENATINPLFVGENNRDIANTMNSRLVMTD